MEEVAVGERANDIVTSLHPVVTRSAHHQAYQPEGHYNTLCIYVYTN